MFLRHRFSLCLFSDFGRNDVTIQGDEDGTLLSSFHFPTVLSVVTHLGNIIKPGDVCAGYDLTCAQFNDEALESYQGLQLPEVILVKKGKSNAPSCAENQPDICRPIRAVLLLQFTKSPLAAARSSSRVSTLKWKGLHRSACVLLCMCSPLSFH